jgi:hypothetical protein
MELNMAACLPNEFQQNQFAIGDAKLQVIK